jgi:hypothetical protein
MGWPAEYSSGLLVRRESRQEFGVAALADAAHLSPCRKSIEGVNFQAATTQAEKMPDFVLCMVPKPLNLAPLTLVLVLFFKRFIGVVFEINRDFPYQVPLSFDEGAMEELDWLEEDSALTWDIYVDLPANTVRYCFRTLVDVAAFRQRFGHAPEGRAVAGVN